MNHSGTVKWWNDDAGYGFISALDGKDVYVTADAIEGAGYKTLIEGDVCEFELMPGPQLRAAKVQVVGLLEPSVFDSQSGRLNYLKCFYGDSIRYLQYQVNEEVATNNLTIRSVSLSPAKREGFYALAVVFDRT